MSDESESVPYWLLRSLAEYLEGVGCEDDAIISCDQSSKCITEWCPPCAAAQWLKMQRHQEKIATGERICVYCGCTESKACAGGCSWLEMHPGTLTGICSRCLEKIPRVGSPQRPIPIVITDPPAA
jgi:hypothetical protein